MSATIVATHDWRDNTVVDALLIVTMMVDAGSRTASGGAP